MRITIQTCGTAGTELETDRELHRAFNALHNALIQTRGGSRFADNSVQSFSHVKATRQGRSLR